MPNTKIKDRAVIMTIIAFLAIIAAIGVWGYAITVIQTTRAEFADLQPKVEKLKVDNVSLAQEKEKMVQEKKQIDNEISRLETDYNTLQNNVKNGNTESEKLQGEIADKKRELEDKKRELDETAKRLADAQDDGAKIKDLLNQANLDLTEKTSIIANLQNNINAKENELSKIKAQLATVSQNGDILSTIKELLQKVEKRASEVSQLQSERDKAQRERDVAQNERAKIQQKLNDCKDDYRKYINRMEHYTSWDKFPRDFSLRGPDGF